jgi:hypothetical protein
MDSREVLHLFSVFGPKVPQSVEYLLHNDEEVQQKGSTVASRLKIRDGLLPRLRETRGIPSEEHQARLMGIDRGTLRRIDAGATPSGAFMAAMYDTYGLGLGEAFEFVEYEAAIAA